MSGTHSAHPQSSRGEVYSIRIGQHLDAECSAWLAGLVITNLEGGEAILSGSLPDQSALYGLIQTLRNWNVSLLAISRGQQI
jgi:hypothetical protein